MHDIKKLSVSTHAQRVFTIILLLYPSKYIKRYGNEMRIVFEEMYQEELAKKGKVGIEFWIAQIVDTTKSVFAEHFDEMKEKGMKKYLTQTLHMNRYNIIGGIFLLPIFTVFIIDLVARIVQGDLTRYNRPVYALLSHSPLYWKPFLFIWVILFPFLAVAINLIPLIRNARKKHFQIINVAFLKRNVLSVLLLAFGLFSIALVRFHDFAPCMVHGLLRVGVGQFFHIIAVCRKA